MGSLYRPRLRNGNLGAKWRIKFTDGAGRCIRESTGTTSRREAERMLRVREGPRGRWHAAASARGTGDLR